MAVTVLIMIVMIISFVFKQAHNAWGSGTRTAGAETALRSVMGTLERDLTHAVDAEQFGQANSFTPTDIEFATLDGTNRAPQLVHYSFSGGNLSRSTIALSGGSSPTNWVAGVETTAAIINGSQLLSVPAARAFFTFVYPASDPTHIGLPLRVEIEAHAIKSANFALVSGWSEGRNRSGHPEDKILVLP